MILPTPEFDPLFANDGEPFRAKMLRYIEREFADLVGDRRGLLHSDEGLKILAALADEHLQDYQAQRKHAG